MAFAGREWDAGFKKGEEGVQHKQFHAWCSVFSGQVLVWSLALPEALSPAPLHSVCNSGIERPWCVFRLCFFSRLPLASPPLLPPHPVSLFSFSARAAMVRPRERLLSRRGTTRGGSSRTPVEGSQSFCCRCRCHSFPAAHPIQSRQFMDSYSPNQDSVPAPAFGSAIFAFNSSMDRPRINAHVSVLFLEEAQSVNDEHRHQGMQQDERPEFSQASPGKEVEEVQASPGKEAVQAPSRIQPQEASTSKQADTILDPSPSAEEFSRFGWYPIVEEEPEE